MSVSEKINNLGGQVKDGVRGGLLFMFLVFLRSISGFFLGLTFALIGQEIFSYSSLGLLLVLLTTLVVFVRLSKNWTVFQVIIFDLICVLVGQILKMYILLAP